MMNATRSLRNRSTDPATGIRSLRLQARRARQRLISALAITGLLATGGAVFMAVAPATSAAAADLGPISTSFEIDGDMESDGAVDWNDLFGNTPLDPYTTASGDSSSGVIDAEHAADSGAALGGTCGVDDEVLSVFPGGAKINDDPWDDLIDGAANAKGDACSGGSAYEVVNVDGDDHIIFYHYWTRYSGNGDMTSYSVFEGPDGSTRDDDYLIEFNYDPSGNPNTVVRVLSWVGNSWEPIGNPIVFQAAVGPNTETGSVAGENDTFGEMAIDLTASGLLPSDGTCETFLVSGFITRTGNSDTATLQDRLIANDPITLSNCGNLVVKKLGTDGAPDATFDYSVTRTGGGPVHDGTLVGPTDTVAGPNGLGADIGIADVHEWKNVFAGDDYQIAESAPPAPWALKGYSCTVDNPTSGETETTTDGTFNLYVGATTTCTITNESSGVKITKVAQGDPATFDFTVSGQQGDVQVPGGQSSQVFWYTPGTVVDITEIAEPGTPEWNLTGVSCAPPGNAQTDVATATASVLTVAGMVVDCTFTNRQDGQIKIIKNVAGANGTFAFTTTGADLSNFDLTTVGGTATKLFDSVTPGAYTVTESTPAPFYDLTGLSCVEDVTGDSVTSLVDGKVTITVQPGELVTCTYTNTQRGNIIVTKQTNPDGSAQEFDFTLTGQSGFVLKDGQSKAFDNVKPGAYTLAELAEDGWDVTSMTCSGETPTTDSPIGITLSPGETVECTVLNTATKGEVTVEKKVDGVPDGFDWSFPISISPVPAGQQGTIDATDDDPIVEWTNLDVGTQYTLTEGGLEGWDEGAITCTGIADESDDPGFQFTVTPGLSLECEVTNEAEPGEVTVEKTVSGVADDTAWEFDLTIDPADGVLPSATQTVSGVGNTTDTVTWTNLVVGEEYTVTETLPAGWTGGVVECGPDSNDQQPGDQFVVTPGFSLECSVENEAEPASAKVTKTSVGAAGSFTFVLTPLDPAGDPVEQIITTPAGGGVGDTTFTDLVPGTTYSLAEADPGAGWVTGDLVCEVTHAGDDTAEAVDESGFTVLPGDVFECDITNTAKGTIIIVKNIDGADGTFQFTGNWPWAGNPSIGSFGIETENGTGTNTYGNVVAGSYSVTELLTSAHVGELIGCVETRTGGADDGSSVDAQNPLKGLIDLDPGETITCTYSNTELGKIIVDKNVTFDSDQSFDFEYGDGGTTTPFALTGDATPWESGLIEPGSYTVEELGEANWTLQSLQCSGSEGVTVVGPLATIELAAGEVVTCTYVNTPDTGDVTIRKIVEGVPQGYPFDFEIAISPAVGAQPATQHVTEDDSSVSWTDLVVGETYTLTEGDEGGWNEGDFVCNGGSLEDADDALAGFQFEVTPGLSISCTITNEAVPGEVTVTKHVTGVPDGFAWSFPLTISPADGVEPVTDPLGQQTVSGVGNVTDSVTWTNLEIGTVYTVTEGALPPGWSGGTVTCTDSDPQTVGNQFVATPGATLSCDVTNDVVPPTGVITKELTSITQATDGTWDLVYEVKVTNQSPVAPLVYDLDDQPYFGVGIVINEASAEGPSDEAADWDPNASNYVLADDASVPASDTDTYVITINATAGAEVYETSQDQCQEGETTLGGFRNTAFLIVGDGEPQPATDCDEPGRTTVTKELIGIPVRGDDGDWTVTYEVVVTNESDTQDQYYDLEDDLGFPAGVEIVSAEATNDAGFDTSGWNGDTETTLADDAAILKSAVHTYTIVVVADVDEITEIDHVTCEATTSGRGFFNAAVLDNGTIVTEVEDCDTIPVGRLTLEKHVDLSAFEGITPEDLGLDPETFEHLAPMDWLLTADGAVESVAVLGHLGSVFTVPTGDYGLSEAPTEEASTHPLLDYFESQGWICDNEGEGDDTALVKIGELTSCDLTNRGELVDVGIEKDYDLSGLPDDAIEGGDEFSYVLTVTNHSSIDVEELDVTDLVDPELEVTGAATFEGAGTWTEQPTVGDNDFAAHGVGPFEPGDVTTITIPVRLPEPEPVETDIVGPDDPVPPTPEIELGDVPNEACVAITSGEGVLGDLIEANNCDEVEVPRKAIDPAAYVRCIADVPWLYFDVAASENVEPGDITVTWTSADGTLTKVQTIPWEDREGRLLWPGAAVDENGVPFEFPGWRPITEEDLTNPPTPGTRFGTLILDETVPTYPWRDMENPATITFSVNPSQSVLAVYPQALPACELDREPAVDIVKTASVEEAKPGTNFDYTLEVTATGIGSADMVEVFDEIPSHLRVDDITTAASPAFPRWEACEVTGEDADGYGGLLHCELLGVLGPDYPEAPPIVLDVHVDPGTTATSVENTGEVCWQNAADTSEDPEVVCDDSTVTVRIPQPVAVTGFDGGPFIWGAVGLVLLGGLLVAAGIVIRRRRQGEHAV